ncbi:MAG: hypothetical protein K2H53_03320, partial [Clostridia bacterium]|nr:hypothetical protein [Clostridia bacterium]
MKVKENIKNITKVIILITIIVCGIFLSYAPYVSAVINKANSAQKAEIFKDDLGILNDREHPTHLFADYGIYLFCGEHGTDVNGYMTATQAHYTAWENKSLIGKANYDENNPYYKYSRSASEGLYKSHRSEYNSWVAALSKNPNYCCVTGNGYNKANKDDQNIINSLESALPGIGNNPVAKSIEYRRTNTYNVSDYPDAAFILTQQKIYANAKTMPKDAADEAALTNEEKEKGYFNIDEKQFALWETRLNVGKNNDGDDRNLGDISKYFAKFYEIIRDGYDKIVNVLSGDGKGGKINEISSVGLGEDKAYKYNDAKVEIDQANQSYVIGPFCVDYTVDDENCDIYSSFTNASGEKNQVKFNAIEKITVYDQNKVDIETLGGYFKVAYAYNGGIPAGEEGKLRRISDEYYYEKADYQEISAFESNKPFYIVAV